MKPLLLYDADCGFCTRAVAWVPRLRLKVSVRAMQSVDLDGVGVSPSRAARELPLVRADGTVAYGHEAIAAALATGSLPLRLLGRLLIAPGCSGLFSWFYRTVAAHRHELPGGTASCALPPT